MSLWGCCLFKPPHLPWFSFPVWTWAPLPHPDVLYCFFAGYQIRTPKLLKKELRTSQVRQSGSSLEIFLRFRVNSKNSTNVKAENKLSFLTGEVQSPVRITGGWFFAFHSPTWPHFRHGHIYYYCLSHPLGSSVSRGNPELCFPHLHIPLLLHLLSNYTVPLPLLSLREEWFHYLFVTKWL